MKHLFLVYSLADQNFNQTKSIGIFNVSTQLLENLARRIPFGQLRVLSNSTLEHKLSSKNINIQYHDEAIASKLGRIVWDQLGVYKAAARNGSNWLFLPKGFVSFFRLPLSLKLAVYAHDTMHDFYETSYPGFIPWLENKYFKYCLRNTLKYSNVIFTNSDFTKEELKRMADKFKLIPPLIITAGVGFTRAEEGVSQKRDSLLLLTSVWPHKLTERAVNFVARWKKQAGFSGSVHLVGSLPSGIHLPDFVDWRHHSRLSESIYGQLLRGSKALLFFSAYEGFGLPPVEAMIVGTCPVFSDLPVTREVMGGRGFSFSNDSYESFAQSMDRAISAPETQIQLWAEQLLERHSWHKVTEKIINGLTSGRNKRAC